jgi:ribosomal protein S18 acetylase RimI-like enzyme
VRIRAFRVSDTEAVLSLWERSEISRPWLDLRAEIVEKLKRDRSLFLVADDMGVVVGAVMGAYDGRRGWVYHLAVEPGRRHAGIGRQLMHGLEERMTGMGVVKVNLQVRHDNLGVVDFYKALDYRDERLTSMGKRLRPAGDMPS